MKVQRKREATKMKKRKLFWDKTSLLNFKNVEKHFENSMTYQNLIYFYYKFKHLFVNYFCV